MTRKTIRFLEERCSDPETESDPVCLTRPFYLAVTSTGDIPTGVILPIANAVLPAITSDHLHPLSAANTPWLHTHNVVKMPSCPEAPNPPIALRMQA